MVCCLIGAFLLGMIFRAARWTRRSVASLLGVRRTDDAAATRAPTPVYELPDYLVVPAEAEERIPALV